MKAIILAGGFGTRLKEIVSDVPKPMALIAGKPFLEHQIYFLKEQGITEIILAVHYMSDKIKSYFGNGTRFGVEITYSEEEKPLGTAGAIKKAQKYIDDTFLVLNGDSYSQIDIKEFIEFHQSKNSKFSIILKKVSNGIHYGKVSMVGSKIVDLQEKKEGGESIVNSGVYLFEPIIFDYIEEDKYVSLEKEVFPILAKEGLLYGQVYDGYFMDIGRPETYHQFKSDVIKTLMLPRSSTILEAMQKISRSGIDFVALLDQSNKLQGVINNRLIREHILRGGDVKDSVESAMIKNPVTAKITDGPEVISNLLLSGIHHLPILDESGSVVSVEFHSEKIKSENFPIVMGKAPLRISFAGGGTDLPYFFEKYGGVVINTTIDKYSHAILIKRADSKIIINSDTGDELIIDSKKSLNYNGKYDLIKAIINVMKPEFGFEIYLHNDVPPGRGLGSSATLAVLIVSLLSHVQDLKYDDYKIAEIAYKAEIDELKIKGGWQDQYAAVTGGFSFMEFTKDKSIIYPLRLKKEVIDEFNSCLSLCYVGNSHYSGDLQKNVAQNFIANEQDVVNELLSMKNLASKIKDCLLTNELQEIGKILHESWESKKKLGNGISNPVINNLYDTGLRNGAHGGKLLGAGGGGYILFFHSPKVRNHLKRALEKAGGEIMNFNFESGGTVIHTVKSKI